MPRYDERTATCLVFTRKAGVLSAMGHDLKLRVMHFTVDVDAAETAVDARFDTASLRVVCALRDGSEDPKALSEAERLKIERAIRDDVLASTAHPEAWFRSTAVAREGDRVRVTGELTLHGRTRAVEVLARTEGGRRVAEVTVHQPDWGLRPYSAMLGALRVQPDVRVQVSVPPGEDPGP